MKNVKDNYSCDIVDGTLVIKVNLKKNLGPSKSGKTTLIASSRGLKEIEEGVILNLNVMKS